MPLPLSLWYALRTGHVARGVTAAGEPVRVRLAPSGGTGYEVEGGAWPSETAPDTHGAVFHGDGALCDFLYSNGLDPQRLAVGAEPTAPNPPLSQ